MKSSMYLFILRPLFKSSFVRYLASWRYYTLFHAERQQRQRSQATPGATPRTLDSRHGWNLGSAVEFDKTVGKRAPVVLPGGEASRGGHLPGLAGRDYARNLPKRPVEAGGVARLEDERRVRMGGA